MSVAYVIMCDVCNETAWASPVLRGYRRALGREGWEFEYNPHRDLCPKHAGHRARVAEIGNRIVTQDGEILSRLA
jgi:hypothetical protein